MSVGYPDYSRTQAEAGDQLGSFFGQKGNDPATGRMDCIGYAYLTLGVDDVGSFNYYTIVVTFYDDFGMTNIIGTRALTPVPGARFPYQVPVISRYAIVTCSHIVFGDTGLIGCIVYGSNIPVVNIGDAQGGQPFIYTSASLGTGASSTVNALFVHEGPATLYAGTASGSTYVVRLLFYNTGIAAFSRILDTDGLVEGRVFVKRISLPPCPVQLTLINTDSVTRTLTGAVILG